MDGIDLGKAALGVSNPLTALTGFGGVTSPSSASSGNLGATTYGSPVFNSGMKWWQIGLIALGGVILWKVASKK